MKGPFANDNRLIERLYLLSEHDAAPKKQRGDSQLIASIKAHLRRFFSTRQGTVAASPDYGLPVYGDADAPDIGDFMDLLKSQIERFEPRLHSVDIELLQHENPQAMAFSIFGTVNSPNHERFQLDIMLDSNVYNIMS